MKRRLLNFLAACSLLLCVAVVALWVQSQIRPVLWVWPWDSHWQFESTQAELRIIHQIPRAPGLTAYMSAYETVLVPYWFLACIAAAGIAPRFLPYLSRRRRKARAGLNLCSRCDYDLTGNVSGVCPECGHSLVPAIDSPRAR